MKTPIVVAVDCSTTACKAIAWDAQGRFAAAPQSSSNPPPTLEQDAEVRQQLRSVRIAEARQRRTQRPITHQRDLRRHR
jgi:sugar (pentulose or hexulose) kinase